MRPLVLLLVIASAIHALEVGEKAPPLDSATWVKGGTVKIGTQVTLVEFWATWCGPCRTSIPHLTKLAKANPDKLAVVGLSNEDEAAVKPFVTRMGAQMDYHVGLADEALHAAYMEGVPGIPHAFLVGADGTVLWKGHPMTLGRTLDAVLDGTFDMGAETRRAQRSAELKALLEGDPGGDERKLLDKVLAKTAEILKEDPSDQEAFDLRLGVASHLQDPGLARATYADLPLDRLDSARAAELATRLVNEESPAARSLDLAWGFAQRAVADGPESAEAHAALAVVQHALGMLDQAIVSQQQAARLDPETQGDGLAFYQEAKRIRDQIAAGGKPTAPASASGKPKAPGLPDTLVP